MRTLALPYAPSLLRAYEMTHSFNSVAFIFICPVSLRQDECSPTTANSAHITCWPETSWCAVQRAMRMDEKLTLPWWILPINMALAIRSSSFLLRSTTIW
jgi:hypothetical protein